MDFISRKDLTFMLNDWLNVKELTEREAFAGHNTETFAQVMDLSADMARDVFAPHCKAADIDEPKLVDGKVITLPEIGEALKQYAEAGFFSAAFPEENGGMHLPMVVAAASYSHFAAANISTSGYAMLTGGSARLIVQHGLQKQIETWAEPAIEGRYFGTMCLSEPQAGSSLSDTLTHARPDGEDEYGRRYKVRGNKMWISGGDQEMSENIVHLVLAKAPDDEGVQHKGVRGLSLFIVPKYLPDGAHNDVVVAGLNHKMGFRGTVNTLLNFGEQGGATGWRVGGAGQGLAIMFQMMNEARIMVGLGAAALAYRGMVQSTQYAKERAQGRPLSAKRGADIQQVPIIEHADVRRMLIMQKAFAEGGLALCLYSAKLFDDEKTAPTPEARKEAATLLDLLTPITKSWPSEFGLVANDQAIQVHGGYGYTREYDVEQLYRDNRLNPIHEGTYGIQGLDFLGRKMLGDGGAGFALLRSRIEETIEKAKRQDGLVSLAGTLQRYLDDGAATLAAVLRESRNPAALDNAGHALTAFGHLTVAWLWLEQAIVASRLDASQKRFKAAKLATCRYFFEVELPKSAHLFKLVRDMNNAVGSLGPEIFALDS